MVGYSKRESPKNFSKQIEEFSRLQKQRDYHLDLQSSKKWWESDFFCKNNPSNIFLNQSKERIEEVNLLIDKIRELSPISIWDLCKKVSMSRSKLFYLIRDLEFAGVIFTRILLNKNNRSSRIIFIRDEEFQNDS